MTEASTTLNPTVPFNLKSGPTTPQSASLAVIAAVPTGCAAWSAVFLTYASRAASSSKEGKSGTRLRLYTSNALEVV
jgi:hypothetical protein